MSSLVLLFFFFFFQAEDGIRDHCVTGVQTCALPISLDEREVKRAGLDYWEYVDLRVWPNWEAFERELLTLGEPYFFSTKATRLFWDAPFGEGSDVVLVFGRETGGLPPELHARYRDRFVTMPILSDRVRSLNLSTSVAIAVYEVLRQRR